MAQSRKLRRRLTRLATVVAVIAIVFAGLVALAWWEMGWQCVRTAERLDAGKGWTYWTSVCLEYTRKQPAKAD